MPEPGWKNPSANFPFLEMSLSPMTSSLLPVRVSPFGVAAEHGGMCREEIRRSPPISKNVRCTVLALPWERFGLVSGKGWMVAYVFAALDLLFGEGRRGQHI